MNNIDYAKVAELQRESASAYALARNAYELAETVPDFEAVTIGQEAAARAYRNAAIAREAALGI